MDDNKLAIYTPYELLKSEGGLLTTKQLDFILKPTPQQYIYTRPAKGGGEWKFVSGTYVKKVLNLMFGWEWSFEVKEFETNVAAKQCHVLGSLTVNVNGKSIVKQQFGRADIKFRKGTEVPLDLGNDLKAATTDALKKCASELGIAQDVYSGEDMPQIKVVGSDEEKHSIEKARIIKALKSVKTVEEIDAFRSTAAGVKYAQDEDVQGVINEQISEL